MRQRPRDIYASVPMRGLLADEAVAYLPEVRRCAGRRKLLITVVEEYEPSDQLNLGHWVTLKLADRRFRGDICADAMEALPFLDRVFDLVLLHHILEPITLSLDEVTRVMAPGGTLIITGMYPVSGWTPWWLWRQRGNVRSTQSPKSLAMRLQRAQLQIKGIQRVGRMFPWLVSGKDSGWFGGGYVLIARKSGLTNTRVRLRLKAVATPARTSLVPGARRTTAN